MRLANLSTPPTCNDITMLILPQSLENSKTTRNFFQVKLANTYTDTNIKLMHGDSETGKVPVKQTRQIAYELWCS